MSDKRQSVQDKVIQDMVARKRVGLEEYGTLLYSHNGRDALQDAYEEALDLCCYLKQALMERDSRDFEVGDRVILLTTPPGLSEGECPPGTIARVIELDELDELDELYCVRIEIDGAHFYTHRHRLWRLPS